MKDGRFLRMRAGRAVPSQTLPKAGERDKVRMLSRNILLSLRYEYTPHLLINVILPCRGDDAIRPVRLHGLAICPIPEGRVVQGGARLGMEG